MSIAFKTFPLMNSPEPTPLSEFAKDAFNIIFKKDMIEKMEVEATSGVIEVS